MNAKKSCGPDFRYFCPTRLRDLGVVVFAVGVGSGINVAELHDIASKPSCTRCYHQMNMLN